MRVLWGLLTLAALLVSATTEADRRAPIAKLLTGDANSLAEEKGQHAFPDAEGDTSRALKRKKRAQANPSTPVAQAGSSTKTINKPISTSPLAVKKSQENAENTRENTSLQLKSADGASGGTSTSDVLPSPSRPAKPAASASRVPKASVSPQPEDDPGDNTQENTTGGETTEASAASGDVTEPAAAPAEEESAEESDPALSVAPSKGRTESAAPTADNSEVDTPEVVEPSIDDGATIESQEEEGTTDTEQATTTTTSSDRGTPAEAADATPLAEPQTPQNDSLSQQQEQEPQQQAATQAEDTETTTTDTSGTTATHAAAVTPTTKPKAASSGAPKASKSSVPVSTSAEDTTGPTDDDDATSQSNGELPAATASNTPAAAPAAPKSSPSGVAKVSPQPATPAEDSVDGGVSPEAADTPVPKSKKSPTASESASASPSPTESPSSSPSPTTHPSASTTPTEAAPSQSSKPIPNEADGGSETTATDTATDTEEEQEAADDTAADDDEQVVIPVKASSSPRSNARPAAVIAQDNGDDGFWTIAGLCAVIAFMALCCIAGPINVIKALAGTCVKIIRREPIDFAGAFTMRDSSTHGEVHPSPPRPSRNRAPYARVERSDSDDAVRDEDNVILTVHNPSDPPAPSKRGLKLGTKGSPGDDEKPQRGAAVKLGARRTGRSSSEHDKVETVPLVSSLAVGSDGDGDEEEGGERKGEADGWDW